MKREDGDAVRLTWDRVSAFRVARHHLAERARKRALVSVVSDMAGAQAQVVSAAVLSLWARVADLEMEDVERALGPDRTLVRAWCMRRTLHLLPSAELGMFVRGSAGRAEKDLVWVRKRGVSDDVLEELIEATLNALDRPITRTELAKRVSRTLKVPMRTAEGGGWGNRAQIPGVAVAGLTFAAGWLLHLTGARGVICHGPNQGNEPTFVRGDAWVPRWTDVSRMEAEGELLRRYLRAFGPSTPADFSLWTGMRLSDSRELWARAGADLAPVNVNGWAAFALREDLPQLEAAKIERPLVRLLPYFDSFLLSHKDRDHLLAPKDFKKVYRAQGWIAPVILVDGRVAGVWAHDKDGERLRIRVSKLRPMSSQIASAIKREAQDLGRFLACPTVDVHIT